MVLIARSREAMNVSTGFKSLFVVDIDFSHDDRKHSRPRAMRGLIVVQVHLQQGKEVLEVPRFINEYCTISAICSSIVSSAFH